MSRVEVCATQTSLSRITQTSWKTMEYHDRPSTTSPLFRIAVDPGGQWRPIICRARSRDVIHPHEKEKREIERGGRGRGRDSNSCNRIFRQDDARLNCQKQWRLLWPTCRTQKTSFPSPKRVPFQTPHSFQVPPCFPPGRHVRRAATR